MFLCLGYVALVLSLGMILATGLIPAWGKWYSKDVVFRRQTQAFLAGSLALDTHPSALGSGMAWAGGGVQQAGGLGVPAWRLPFDAVAKGLGWAGFPDRLAFGLFAAIILFWILLALTVSPSCRSPGEWLSSIAEHPEIVVSFLLLALFPPFLSLCRAGFGFHEEAAAYSYLISVGLLVGTVQFVRKPGVSLYCGLAAAAGLAGFFRPAVLAGGFASLVIAFFHTRVWKWSRRRSFLGVLLFGLGAAALFATNYLRFGSGFEFGPGLALEATPGAMFASRFSHPYASEPFFSAARELFSVLFLAGARLTGEDWSRSGIFPGQSATFRHRELDFSVFDLSFLVLMILAWALAVWRLVRRPRSGAVGSPSEPNLRKSASSLVALWSFLSFLPLAVFYLRSAFISSVSLMDFAPAVAAGVVSCVWAVGADFLTTDCTDGHRSARPVVPPKVGQTILSAVVSSAGGRQTGLSATPWSGLAFRYVLAGSVAAWWVAETWTSKVAFGSAAPVTSQEMAERMDRRSDSTLASSVRPSAIARYSVGSFRNGDIPLNGVGWNSRTGEAGSAVAFFVDDPEWLEILVAPRTDTQVLPADYTNIQARIGLENLVLATNEALVGGRRLVFEFPEPAPKRGMNLEIRNSGNLPPAPRSSFPDFLSSKLSSGFAVRFVPGLQVAVLGFVAPGELTTANSKFRLLGLKWRKSSDELKIADLLEAAHPEGPRDPFHESLARARAQTERTALPLPEAPAATVPLPEGVLAFDSEKKSENVREGDAQARFVFRFTNVSPKEVTITKVTTSCGCTTAELPPMPWKVAPGARGRIPVTMNVAGHTGKSAKTVTVSALQGFVALQVEANILPAPEGAGMPDRLRNLELAKADRQAVFKGGCAECHAATAEGKTGRTLYAAVCGICHEANPRATMVPDLRALNHPTDYSFWKTMTAAGKPGTLMPAFAQDQGGPLTGGQIELLARAFTNGLLSEIQSSPLPAGQGANPKTAARN